MKLENLKANVVCDIAGCTNVAKIFIKKDATTLPYDSLKLCPHCAGGLFKLLSTIASKKENKNASDK